MTKILIEVEGALHKALRIKAIEEGVSMAEAVIEGIKWFVDREQEKGKKKVEDTILAIERFEREERKAEEAL